MTRYKMFLQDSPNDCTAACLASILSYHGLYITPIDLVKDMEITRAGASNHELGLIAARHHLDSKMVSLPIEQFSRLEEPCIAFVKGPGGNGSHAVVVFEVKGENVLIGDPGRGCSRKKLKDFSRVYLGLMMIFRPTDAFVQGRLSKPYLHQFLEFVMEYRTRIFKSLAIGLAASTVGFMMIYLSKFFFDWALPKQDYQFVLFFVAGFFLVRLVGIAINGFNEMFGVTISTALTSSLSDRYFDSILRLKKRHIDSRETGDFIQQFNEIETLTNGVANYFSRFILTVFGFLIKAGLLVYFYDGVIVSVVLFLIGVNTMAGFAISRVAGEQANRKGMTSGRMNTTLINSLADIRVIRLFGAENWIKASYEKLLSDVLELSRGLIRINVYGRSAAEVIGLLSEVVLYAFCGFRILTGQYTIGDFMVFLGFAQSLAVESLQFPSLILSFQMQLRSFARLRAVLELSSEENGHLYPDSKGLEIEFREVTFGYTRNQVVLDGVSFKIRAGEATAIVGQSGSGKSTIMNLIMGFYKPRSGEILINGVPLEQIDLTRYRKDISAVFQDVTIFNKSLFNNVALGQEEISLEQAKRTADMLGLDEFIKKLPMGYETLIYQGYLSGGQVQRIGILRALCKPFKLLLLDEATSHLDSLTEDRIVKGIEEFCGGSNTRLVIAHRLSTVIGADQIIVLQDGKIVEQGAHEDLVKENGYYMKLIERQYEVNLLPMVQVA